MESNQSNELIPALFLHIQKTAGTTIVRMAIDHYGYENVCSHGDFKGKQPSDFTCLPFVSGHFGFNFARELKSERFFFTLLRNPIDRIISFYYFCRTRNPSELPIYRVALEYDLNDFLLAVADNRLVRRRIWNNQVWRLASGPGPGDRGIDAVPPDEMFDQAIANAEQFSYIGFLETFEEDARQILQALNINPLKELSHENATKKKVASFDLPVKTIRLIEEVSKWDFKLYDTLWQKRTVKCASEK